MTERSPLRVLRLLALLGLGVSLPLAALRAAEETPPAAPAPAAPAGDPDAKAASDAPAPTADPVIPPIATPPALPEVPPIQPPASLAPIPESAPIAPLPTPPALEAAPTLEKPAAPSKTAKPDASDAEDAIDWHDRREIVQFLGDVVVHSNQRAQEVVVLGGDATIDGQVTRDLVVIGGDVELNGRARGEIVVIGGDLTLGPKANLGRQVVVIGGEIVNPHGRPIPHQEVIGGFSLSKIDNAAVRWVQRGFFQGRLLVPGIGWPWIVFGAFAVLYLLIAALFPRGIAACVESIEERPAGTVLASFLMLFVLPLALLLLAATLIGLILIPFLFIGLVFAGIFGKASLATFLGRSLFRGFGLQEPAGRILAGLGLGLGLLALLYMVPVAGILTWVITAWYGLGVALFTVVKRMRREKVAPAKPATAGAPASTRRPLASASPATRASEFRGDATSAPASSSGFASPVAPASAVVPDNTGAATAVPAATDIPLVAESPTVAPGSETVSPAENATPRAAAMSAGFVGTAETAGTGGPPPPLPASSGAIPRPAEAGAVPPVLPSTAASSSHVAVNSLSPRAEFWPRLGALVIDIVLIGVVAGVMGLGEAFPFVFGAYSFAMWLWRGTTIGGVVFNLKIVRLDDRPVDPATVLVRVLVGYISLVMAGLGFLWCAWDPEQQTWHDKVAGTIVVRAPKGMSLV